jgi:hypothetical protein
MWETKIFHNTVNIIKVKLTNKGKADTVVESFKQCCGAGAARSRIFWSEPEP